jgi:CP family cyanate transporter-like MFS transporter
MHSSDATDDARARGRLLTLLPLLWLAGVSMRVTVLAVPPVLPLIRADLGMSETQIGLLISLPLVMLAAAAIPGSLLIARFGAALALIAALLLTALAGAGRGAAANTWLLYLATLLMGLGVAVIQPAIPTLVREWLPQRVALGAAVATNGILFGATLGPVLTIAALLPLIGGSWRLSFVLWSLPVLATALLLIAFAPRRTVAPAGASKNGRRWWPDWRNPLIWLLGCTLGSNNALYFATNAFLPDYLDSISRPDLIGLALGCMSASQLVTSTLLLPAADLLLRRAWPYVAFGLATVIGVLGVVLGSGIWILIATTLIGVGLAVTFVVTLALPAALSPPDDVHRMSAGMFTISYSIALAVPIVSGALWDFTGREWTAFIPIFLCAVSLTVLGLALGRRAKG